MVEMSGIDIAGFLCDVNRSRPEPVKVQKILEWPAPTSTRTARAFIGCAVNIGYSFLGFQSLQHRFLNFFEKEKLSYGR